MATIRAYTTIEQSKKLAEILPIESADMFWYLATKGNPVAGFNEGYNKYGDFELPCWSLTALLSVLPNEIITDNRFECHYQISIRKYDGGDNTTLYQIAYGNNRGSSGSWHDMINTGEKDNLVDACYQMIIRLKELKML